MTLAKRFPDQGEIYGMLAFAGTGLAALSSYVFHSRIPGEPWQVALCFILSGLYILGGCFSYMFVDGRPLKTSFIYSSIQGALAITAVFVSPIKGMMGIMLLPLASQAVFMYSTRIALSVGVALWFIAAGSIFFPHGWEEFRSALFSYSPAFLFTIVFSFVTRNALFAREHAIELKNELEAANAQLRAQATQTEELATTRERNRLAREIHDGVGHYLTVINVQAEAAQSLLKTNPDRSNEALEKVSRLSREALADVRRSVGSLRAEDQRPPLIDTLRELSLNATIPTEFKIVGEPHSLSSAAEHTLYRAAQEGITNIAKHARATQSWMELNFTATGRTQLTLQDNGQGPQLSPSNGFGICGMRERVDLLGGSVSTGKRNGGGFQINVEVPHE